MRSLVLVRLTVVRSPPLPLALAIAVAFAAAPSDAAATYSIAAADAETDQVGGAATSCLQGGASVAIVYGAAPGRGVVHAQARVDPAFRGRGRAVELLESQTAPGDIISVITDPSFDFGAAQRQYGIVDVAQRAAGFTGSDAMAYAEDRQGSDGAFAYSVQGNILTGRAVIDQAEEGFRAGGCDLADRLVRALEAGAEGGEGDSRCTGGGIPSDSAFLQVDRPDMPQGSWLRIEVPSEAGRDPLPVLRARYDEWRAAHPCPDVAGDGGARDGGLDAGGAPAEVGMAKDGGAPVEAGMASADSSAPAEAGTTEAGNVETGRDGGVPATNGDGCSCGALARQSGSGNPRGAPIGEGVLAVAAVGWLVRRKRLRRADCGGRSL